MKFEILEDLYKSICQSHIERLYVLYNSNANLKRKTMLHNGKIELLFADSDQINAQSSVDNGDKIIIHKGLLSKTHECIERMIMSDKIYPSSDQQEIISVFIFSIILHYIIAHEFAHLYNGHCEMLKQINNGNNVCLQFAYDSKINITPLDFQTLEMDADALAMCRTIDYVFFDAYHSPHIINLVDTLSSRVGILLKSLNIMFFILRHFLPPIFDINFAIRTHHPNFLRQVMNYNTLEKYLREEHKKDLSSDYIDEKFATDEKSLCELYYIPLVADHYLINLNSEMLKHEQALRSNWIVLREKLSKYSRTQLVTL